MAEWTVNGFKITMYKGDHPPLHCHVRKDGRVIGKYNLETGTWMTGPKTPWGPSERGHSEMEAGPWNLKNLASSTSACPMMAP
jgi:hypothetical protein